MAEALDLSHLDRSSLKSKSVLIIGGASVLGLRTALALAKTGAYITIGDLHPSEGIVEIFKTKSLGIQYVNCDITTWQQQVVLFKQAIQLAPTHSLDIVICFPPAPIEGHLIDILRDEEPSIDVEPLLPATIRLDHSSNSIWQSCILALHFFRLHHRSSGTKSSHSHSLSRSPSRSRSISPVNKDAQAAYAKTIILMSSLDAYHGDSHNSFRAISDSATRGLFNAIRVKAQDHYNVRVNLIAPGIPNSPLTSAALEELKAADTVEQEEKCQASKASIATASAAIDGSMTPKSPAALEESRSKSLQVNSGLEVSTSSTHGTLGNGSQGAPGSEGENITESGELRDQSTMRHDVPEAESPNGTDSGGIKQLRNDMDTAPVSDHESSVLGESSAEPLNLEQALENKTGAEVVKAKTTESNDNTPISTENITSAVIKAAVDISISGRALAVTPEGVFDLNDDFNGSFGGAVTKQLLIARKGADGKF